MSLARARRRAPVLLAAGVLTLALAACSGGGDDSSAPKTKAPEGSTLELVAGDVRVESTGNPGSLADADRDAIVDTIRKYVIAATIDPLHGKKVGDLEPLFTPQAGAALAGFDRAAALDEGMPKATGTVAVESAPLLLTALSDPTGAINLVGTSLYLDAKADSDRGPIRVQRSGELVLTRDAGTWKISSFKLAADRTGAGLRGLTTTSTTADSAP